MTKFFLVLSLCATFAVVLPASVANADKVSDVTCEQFLAMDEALNLLRVLIEQDPLIVFGSPGFADLDDGHTTGVGDHLEAALRELR